MTSFAEEFLVMLLRTQVNAYRTPRETAQTQRSVSFKATEIPSDRQEGHRYTSSSKYAGATPVQASKLNEQQASLFGSWFEMSSVVEVGDGNPRICGKLTLSRITSDWPD